MATRVPSHEMVEPVDIAVTSGSDAKTKAEEAGFTDEKVTAPSVSEKHLPSYGDEERGDDSDSDVIHRPAEKDDILTHTIHLDDDPTMSALTFRTFFLGIGLAIFGGVLSSIYYFKPQTVSVSTVFLAVITYLLGEAMALIPRKGWLGNFLNPHPFNVKEHLAIVVCANAASISALGIEVLSVERLYYNSRLNGALAVFMLFSSQFLGYGIAGLMRRTLVYPKVMLWPANLPVNSMLETLHRRTEANRKPLKVFLIVFAVIFCWEIIPEWICPLLTGISIFCLANQHSAVFTNVFGGASGNEGLGLFSWCMDWEYISGGYSPLFYPMDSLISQGVGITGCIILFTATYYGNVWNAKNFPFLSQILFSENSTMSNPIVWNQTAVIGADNYVDQSKLAEVGLPYFATTNAINMLVTNMSVTAAITHLFLWHFTEMKDAFRFLHPDNLKKVLNPKNWSFSFASDDVPDENQPHYDPHYKVIMAYKAVPDWWFAVVLLLSFIIGMVIIYEANSTLPWWGFIVAMILGYFFLVIFGAMQGITGIAWLVQPIVQMIGGYIQPGNPVSNMYFSLYGYNALVQGQLLSQDLKLAQYGHLAPRVTFTMQMLGTLIGAVFNYIMANSIIDSQFDILLSIEGTNIWSGQQAQTFNSQAVAWGGLAHELFSVGGTYEWMTLIFIPGFFVPVPFWLAHKKWPHLGLNNINTAIIVLYLSWLCVGINSSLMAFFAIGLTSQVYIRRRYPNLFVKYNYLVSAALDGGTSVIIFILSFAVFGAAGPSVNFPVYPGNNMNGNFDLCLYTD